MHALIGSGPRASARAIRWLGFPALLLALTSCATFSEPYSVKVVNDLRDPVTLAVCDSHDCSKRIDPWTLKPGQIGALNVEINGGYNPAIILAHGAVAGC